MGANRIEALVVVLNGLLAWLIAAIAVATSTDWPLPAAVAVAAVFGVLVGAVSRAIAAGPRPGSAGVAGRAAVALVVGVLVGELAMIVMFSGTIDRRLDEEAARRADATPAVVEASAALERARAERASLDQAVDEALQRRDEALVVARCEYNPSPDCPQTRITGVPGAGPENRTAGEFLADTQQRVEDAVAEREARAPGLDARVNDDEAMLTEVRQAALAGADRGLGARWSTLNALTATGVGVALLRLATVGFFALLCLLPLILRRWRGETTDDRGAAAHAEQHRAELDADTAIAVRRAEVRAAVETLWADQQLASAQMAVEAQNEIDREQHRRRVLEARSEPTPIRAQRMAEPVVEDIYLPIAAEAEAASLAAPPAPENLPAPLDGDADNADNTDDADDEAGTEVAHRAEGGGLQLPTIPDVTRAATRWIRPFVPPIVAGAIGTATKPLRGALHVFEEEEEINYSVKRRRRVTVATEAEQSDDRVSTAAPAARHDPPPSRRDETRAVRRADEALGLNTAPGQARLGAADGPRQLPPVE